MDWESDGARLGLPRWRVRVADSDPAWAKVYARLEPELWQALGSRAVGIEHVGSTSVPGLPAKPILDVAIGLGPDADRDAVIQALCSIGFTYRGDGGNSVGHLLVWEDAPEHRLVHLHVIPHGGHEWRHYVVVRDRLRADPTARDAYASLKRELAERFSDDRPSYTKGKAEFITGLLDERGVTPVDRTRLPDNGGQK